MTKVALVDLSGGKPALLETATYDGGYVSARLVDGTVRLVTSFRADVSGRHARATDARPALETRRSRPTGAIAVAATELDDVLPVRRADVGR